MVELGSIYGTTTIDGSNTLVVDFSNVNVIGTFTSNIKSVLDNTLTGLQNVFQPFVPPGAVMSFATKGPPQGWLECNGQTLPITSYPNLSQVLGTTWGGDGIYNFAIPNLNGFNDASGGNFIRGGTVTGNKNPDSTKKPTKNFNITASSSAANAGTHAHDHLYYNQGGSTVYAHNTFGDGWYRNHVNTTNGGRITNYAGDHNHTITTTINDDDLNNIWDGETAPIHVVLLYCIKY